jgi:hypothetical protein
MLERNANAQRGRYGSSFVTGAFLASAMISMMLVGATTSFAQSRSCNVAIDVTNATDVLTAIQVDVDYSGGPAGGLSGCTFTSAGGVTDANVDNGAGSATLAYANNASTFQGPATLVNCTYISTDGADPVNGDIVLDLIDASEGAPIPMPASPVPTLAATVSGCADAAPECGNDVIEDGEQCDGTAGCSAACTVTGSCPASPVTNGCFSSDAGKSQLKLKDGDAKKPAKILNSKDQAQVKISKVESEITGALLGDPTSSTDYSWCLYDATGLVSGGTIPAGDPGWKCKLDKPGKEHCQYKDKNGTNFGISGGKVKAGPAGKGQAQMKVKSKAGTYAAPNEGPTEMLTGPFTMQVTSSDGLCLSIDFATAKKNDAVKGQFQAKGP